jgi:hypothetical protein
MAKEWVNKDRYNPSQVSRLLQKFFNTYLIFKVKLESRKTRWTMQDLDVPRKV